MRETEQEKLDEWAKKKLDDDEVYVEQQQQAIYKREKEKHEKSLDIKKRLSRVLPYRREFEDRVMARRQRDYERERVSAYPVEKIPSGLRQVGFGDETYAWPAAASA